MILNSEDSVFVYTPYSDTSQTKLWVNFLAAMITQPDVRFIESSQRFVRDHKKLLKWKVSRQRSLNSHCICVR